MILRKVFLVFMFALVLSPCHSIADEQQRGKLYFSFISSAYYMEKRWGQGMPIEGVKRTAEVAHANGIPVTWLVNAKSAEAGAALFTEYHEKYGDEVGLMLSANQEEAEIWGGESAYMRMFLDKKKLYKWAKQELEDIQKALPWAYIVIAGTGYRSNDIIKVFEKLGMKAVWGHCWEQTYTDGISDRGAPWGFYYVNPDAYKIPNTAPGGLVAIEWTARDLNLSFRTGRPEVFSTDPNDVQRARIVEYRDIDYWKGFFDEYARNTAYNAVVPLMVHQEAHEMECTGAVCANNEETIQSTAEMLDELFKYARASGAEIVPASQAVQAYAHANAETPPTYALFRNLTPTFMDLPQTGYNSGYTNEQLAAFPEAFVYIDKNGQLFFDRGRTEPVRIDNYIGIDENSMENPELITTNVPAPTILKGKQSGRFTVSVTITSTADTAYGLAFWDEFTGCRIASGGAPGTRILENGPAFIPLVLKPGLNEFLVSIECGGAQ